MVVSGDEPTEIVRNTLVGYQHSERNNTRCAIFVHGVMGNMYATWIEPKSRTNFFQLIANDDELQDYDVFTFGYRTGYWRGAPIDNAAVQLRAALTHLPQSYENIVFIAHSMGGLICMKYIIDELQRLPTPPPIAGLLLYGTPTTGSDLINVAKAVGYGIGLKVPGVRALANLFLRSQRQITDLATGSEFLSRLHTEWAYRVVNGGNDKADKKMWLPVRVITGEDDIAVKEASGKGVYGAIDWEPISCGHLSLVKPDGMKDKRYLAAKSFLQISRRIDSQILDRVWRASQDVWRDRFARVSESLEFSTAIRDHRSVGKSLKGFVKCATSCEYDFMLEEDHIEFGVSFGENDLWARTPLPVYVHQIGLNLLPKTEKEAIRAIIDSMLVKANADEVWSFFFPEVSLLVDRERLVDGEFVWPKLAGVFANWLLRRYTLPPTLHNKVGTKVKLAVNYNSIVPFSLPHFTFSAPWLLNGAKVRVLVEGDFEYFVSFSRLVPRGGSIAKSEQEIGNRREVNFSYEGIMLPGSAMEVRWQRRAP